ncbi:hypothetical protein [Streptomyces sp. NPDC017868]|uniref:hypothetical protein n=1 Tax=unclassified Streptomyces TaxID=2593676 RepID=UPI00379E6CE6
MNAIVGDGAEGYAANAPYGRLVATCSVRFGPRRLWSEAEAAHAWWLSHGRPGPERFGPAVTATGESAWLDDPGRPVPLTG